jgi:AP-3 complex subunit mu
MIESLFISEKDGTVLIEKQGKSRVSRRIIDEYFSSIQKHDSILCVENYYVLSIQIDSLCLIGVCLEGNALGSNQTLTIAFYLLRHLQSTFEEYFGTLTPLTIKEHFDIVYELLEEMLDNGPTSTNTGLPYITEMCILKGMVPPPSFLTSVINNLVLGPKYINLILVSEQLSQLAAPLLCRGDLMMSNMQTMKYSLT